MTMGLLEGSFGHKEGVRHVKKPTTMGDWFSRPILGKVGIGKGHRL